MPVQHWESHTWKGLGNAVRAGEGPAPRRQQGEPCKSLRREQIPSSRSPLAAGLGRICAAGSAVAPCRHPLLWKAGTSHPLPRASFSSYFQGWAWKTEGGRWPPAAPLRMCTASTGGISLTVPRSCRDGFAHNPRIRELQPKRFSPKTPTRFQGTPFPFLFLPALRLQRCHRPREDTLLPPTSPAHHGWGKISVITLQGATGTHTSERRASEKQYVYPPAVSSHLFRQQAAL